MARLFVLCEPGEVTPILKKALAHSNSPLRITRDEDFIYLLGELRDARGYHDVKRAVAEALYRLDLRPNGTDAVLAKGDSVLYLATCECIQEMVGGPPRRVTPLSNGFNLRSGPLGKAELVETFLPPRITTKRKR